MTLVQAGTNSDAARGVRSGAECCGRLGHHWRRARLYDMVGLWGPAKAGQAAAVWSVRHTAANSVAQAHRI